MRIYQGYMNQRPIPPYSTYEPNPRSQLANPFLSIFSSLEWLVVPSVYAYLVESPNVGGFSYGGGETIDGAARARGVVVNSSSALLWTICVSLAFLRTANRTSHGATRANSSMPPMASVLPFILQAFYSVSCVLR